MRQIALSGLRLHRTIYEHGDHLDTNGQVSATAQDPPEYFIFRRVSAEQVAKETHGVDVVPAEGGGVQIDPRTRLPVAWRLSMTYSTGAENLVKADSYKAAGLKELLP